MRSYLSITGLHSCELWVSFRSSSPVPRSWSMLYFSSIRFCLPSFMLRSLFVLQLLQTSCTMLKKCVEKGKLGLFLFLLRTPEIFPFSILLVISLSYVTVPCFFYYQILHNSYHKGYWILSKAILWLMKCVRSITSLFVWCMVSIDLYVFNHLWNSNNMLLTNDLFEMSLKFVS